MIFSEKLKKKFFTSFSFIFKDVLYRLDWRKPNKESVKNFLNDNVITAYDLKAKGYISAYKGSQDEKVLKCLKWTINTLKYQKDSVKWGTPENWEYIQDILARWYILENEELKLVGTNYTKPKNYPNSFRAADCESGSMVFYCACVVNGINPLQLKFCAGDVVGGGHAWAEYASDEMHDYVNDKQNFFVMDWCYYPDTKPFRLRTKKSSRYIRAWFELNHMRTK